jgi:hypothetical protein
MTDEEKLQAIRGMGIDWTRDCPSKYGLKTTPKYDCEYCWIQALEAAG